MDQHADLGLVEISNGINLQPIPDQQSFCAWAFVGERRDLAAISGAGASLWNTGVGLHAVWPSRATYRLADHKQHRARRGDLHGISLCEPLDRDGLCGLERGGKLHMDRLDAGQQLREFRGNGVAIGPSANPSFDQRRYIRGKPDYFRFREWDLTPPFAHNPRVVIVEPNRR